MHLKRYPKTAAAASRVLTGTELTLVTCFAISCYPLLWVAFREFLR